MLHQERVHERNSRSCAMLPALFAYRPRYAHDRFEKAGPPVHYKVDGIPRQIASQKHFPKICWMDLQHSVAYSVKCCISNQ